MKDHTKGDILQVDNISAPHNLISSTSIVGDASKNTFCVYDNKRHAVGSIIVNEDEKEFICSQDGTWQIKA